MKMPDVDIVNHCKNEIEITVRVRRINELWFRLWLGKAILKIAFWVLPAKCKIEEIV